MNPALPLFWQRYGLTALLSLAGVVSIAAIGFETQWGQALRTPMPAATGASRATEIVATLPPFALASLDNAYRESADRPLFSPTRRLLPVNTGANTVAMVKGKFKLTGTSVNAGLSIAYLLDSTTSKTQAVMKGKEVLGNPGLTVDVVEPSRVVLKLGDDTEVLELRTTKSPPPPAVPPPGAPLPPGVPPPLVPNAPNAGSPPTATVRAVAPIAMPVPAGQNMVGQPGQPTTMSSALPGFVPQTGGAAQTATPADAAAAQRRRRFQNPTPQQ